MLTLLLLPSSHLLILGDFNIHWDCERNADTKQLADILRSANFTQYVHERKHRYGRILDLVISHDDDNLTKGVSVSSMLSDHFFINIDVSLQKQYVSAKVISYRKYNSASFLLICESLLWYWIHQMMWIIWWISIIVH